MHIKFEDYLISDDKNLLNHETIHNFLSRSYWANNRSNETIRTSLEASICVGVYHGTKQIGLARLVTDHATVYWLCDVFIDEDYRGKGIGKKMIESITTAEEYKNLLGVLGTKDAHGLYKSFNFDLDSEKLMLRRPDFTRNTN